MAGKFYEPQTPLMQGGDFYYPQTTAGQVILPDGRRLGNNNGLNVTAADFGALTVDSSDGIQGNAAPSNADMLGGIAAEEYATKDMIITDAVSISLDESPILGEAVGPNASFLNGLTYEEIRKNIISETYPIGALYFSYTGEDPNVRWNWMKWSRIDNAYILTSTINSSNQLVMNQVPALIWHRIE